MSGSNSLCAFCRFIPFDVDTLEKLRSKARSKHRSRGPRRMPLDVYVGEEKQFIPEGNLKTVFALGKTERVFSSNCRFCRVVTMALREVYRGSEWKHLTPDLPLRVTWSHDGPGSKGVFTINDTFDTYLCFVTEQDIVSATDNSIQSSACFIHPTAARLEASNVLRWIANCKENHGAHCNAGRSITGPIKDFYRGLKLMRFIDVRKMCIVEQTEAVRYVALSYVWGAVATVRLTKINLPQMRKPEALEGLELPTTIDDAIDLAWACGERYLWVDSLCIVQDDAEDLDAGTRVMDLIYERSEYTIVAASGHDASSGLPGVKFGSRTTPAYIEVSPGCRVGILSELESLISASCYDTRGWTMQEEMLSKRVLYFLNDKIYLHCPYKTMFEGCHEPLRRPPNGAELSTGDPLQEFQRLIEEYSMRVLTKDDDAFRAISGILGRISDTQQWLIIAGMPTIALGRMVLFEKRHHILRRRLGFPSYSWLGWKGAVVFKEDIDTRHGWIVWYVRKPPNDILSVDYRPSAREVDTETIELLVANDGLFQSKPLAHLLRLRGIEADQTVPSDGAGVHRLRPFPLLCFWTLAVFFNLDRVDYVKGTAQIQTPATRSRIPFQREGKVTLDGLDDRRPPSIGEFILLSRMRLHYTVLLIDWVDGVAERRGIGWVSHVLLYHSLSPGPIWKEIVLGLKTKKQTALKFKSNSIREMKKLPGYDCAV